MLRGSWVQSVAGRLLCFAAIVASYLLACRAIIVFHQVGGTGAGWGTIAWLTIERFAMDALAVVVVTAAAMAIARVSPRAATILFMLCAAGFVLMGAVNVRVMSVYQQPATINLFRYGDFLQLDGLRTLGKYTTDGDELIALGAVVGLLSFGLVPWVQRRLLVRRWGRLLLGLALSPLIAAPLLGLRLGADERRAHANAGWALLKSAILPPAGRAAAVADPDLADPFETYALPNDRAFPQRPAEGKFRNVVMIVLESVGTEYLEAQMAAGKAPNLRALASRSSYFPNTYAPMPSSTAALFSLMTAMYPPVSPVAIPMREPDFPAPTVAEALRTSGRRVGVFSANWGFMDFGSYLRPRGVHLEEIADSKRCAAAVTVQGAGGTSEVSGEAERCSVAALQDWVGQSDQPFFALLWTFGTHYPYGLDPAAIVDDPNSAKRAYLAGIQRTDRLVGGLVAWLGERGRLRDTLLVIVGDHGESFAQHGNRVHGNDIYREAVRVPLIVHGQGLAEGRKDVTPVRMIDVPPTILSLAHVAAPSTMQGVDLSGSSRPRRAFFAAAWLNFVMGYQEGRMKYNYAFVTDRLEAYDLASDPAERFDLGQKLGPQERARIIHRIMNWKAAVERKIGDARSRKGVSSTSPAGAGS